MSYMKNFTDETREQKKASNSGKRAWQAVQQGRSKLAYAGTRRHSAIYIRYDKESGYKKSLGRASDPRGCKRGGGNKKRCRLCHPPLRRKRRTRPIDVNKLEVFVV